MISNSRVDRLRYGIRRGILSSIIFRSYMFLQKMGEPMALLGRIAIRLLKSTFTYSSTYSSHLDIILNIKSFGFEVLDSLRGLVLIIGSNSIIDCMKISCSVLELKL